ncbi:MAG: hypothetical protein V1736_09765 [Pseudomonadota bacterium]
MEDISAALYYQIKKEIAERYFGTRKAIEEGKAAVNHRIAHHEETLGKVVCGDFCRIYQLLGSKELVEEFWSIAGLENRAFYDRYLSEAGETAASLLNGVKIRGITKKGRYRNLLLDCYRILVADVKRYRISYEEIQEECLLIEEEISQLASNYNLDEILRFVGNMESRGDMAGVLGETIVPEHRVALEAKLAVQHVERLEDRIVEIPVLPPPVRIESQLKDLATRAQQSRPVW